MRTATIVVTAGLLAGIAVPAFAERTAPEGMSIEQALKTLGEAGYREVTKLEADDGVWKVRATKDGERVRARIDARTGAVTTEGKKR